MIGKGNIRIDFERAILEAKYTKEMDGLDIEYITRASNSNAFEIANKDLDSIKYKNEIRFLISKRWFPDLKMSDIFLDVVDFDNIQDALNILNASNPKGLKELMQMNTTSYGFGPGEVLLYFLLNNAFLGGGSSAGVDLIDNGKEYEIKAALLSAGKGLISGFSLGGTVDISDTLSGLLSLKKELLKFDSSIDVGEKTGIKSVHIKGFKDRKFINYLKTNKSNLKSYNEYFKDFQKIAYNEYFKNHPIIFVGSKGNTGSMSKYSGRLIGVLSIGIKQIVGMQVTSGKIKPIINPNK
jgi:hypothetical protein